MLFCQQGNTWYMHTRGTKLPIYQVWWLRESSQIVQTFVPLCEKKKSLKHKTAELQSIQQFWVQLDIVARQKHTHRKIQTKTKTRGSEATCAETRNWIHFWGPYRYTRDCKVLTLWIFGEWSIWLFPTPPPPSPQHTHPFWTKLLNKLRSNTLHWNII